MKKFLSFATLLTPLLVASFCLAKGEGKTPMRVDVVSSPEPVSIYCVPDGSGNPLTTAFTYGGNVVDGTVWVRLSIGNLRVADVPAEDILLVPGGDAYHLCGEEGAVCGTGTTDADGEMALTGPIAGGGHADPSGEGARIVVDTRVLNRRYQATSEPFPLYMNSSDITADGVVDILDVVALAEDQAKLYDEGIYSYRSDLNWDGEIDQIDADMLGDAYGGACSPE